MRLKTKQVAGLVQDLASKVAQVNGQPGPNVALNSDLLDEGIVNLYFTEERVISAIGQAASGTSFPTTPYNGQVFYRTDLATWFVADTVLGYWLGSLETDESGGNSATTTGNLARINGTAGSPIDYDVLIVGMTLFAQANYTGQVVANRNGTPVATLDCVDEAFKSDYALSEFFSAGGRLVTSVSATCNRPILKVLYRRCISI